jgi:hypothetical protein
LYDVVLRPFMRRRRAAPIVTSAGRLTQGQVDKITHACGAPGGTARIDGRDLLVFRCEDTSITGRVLEALQATGETTLSPVANQRYEVPGKH